MKWDPEQIVVSDEEVEAALKEMWPDVTPDSVRSMLQKRIAARMPEKMEALKEQPDGLTPNEVLSALFGFNNALDAVARGRT